ncbi:MAG: sulfur oxidation c-type cytochrome SoxA [Gammaproteobacteria bacterium]|nr:sulfur oxidation c-type cytochrome SoxA [Gammaproteobacteria bacterium]MYD77003.1 sulfur oxidation c-type cytochrome SoxA [Gammaproteobacteria bacterium]MYJ52467.1 sulfur oxidation c-type cytochrome SoxA [Gammaproteobacteria bacterium]
MRRLCFRSGIATLAILLFALSPGEVRAQSPDIDIRPEIRRFQEFFLERFPSVPLEKFNKGPYSLPQSTLRGTTLRFLERLPPFEHALIPARSEWNRTYNGITLGTCMSRYPSASQFPYVLNDRVITVERAILDCLDLQDRTSPMPGSPEFNALVGVFREQANGEPIQIDVDNPALKYLYALGRKMFWARRGQYNYSCAGCHVENAGNSLRGKLISAALGQTAGFPLYSLKRASQSGFGWISLHEQYRRCFIRSGAAPLPVEDEALIALEVYLTANDTGVPLNAPGFHP